LFFFIIDYYIELFIVIIMCHSLPICNVHCRFENYLWLWCLDRREMQVAQLNHVMSFMHSTCDQVPQLSILGVNWMIK
jgi:hypothetical protein